MIEPNYYESFLNNLPPEESVRGVIGFAESLEQHFIDYFSPPINQAKEILISNTKIKVLKTIILIFLCCLTNSISSPLLLLSTIIISYFQTNINKNLFTFLSCDKPIEHHQYHLMHRLNYKLFQYSLHLKIYNY